MLVGVKYNLKLVGFREWKAAYAKPALSTHMKFSALELVGVCWMEWN